MIHPHKQDQVGNATLVKFTAIATGKRITLQFDRDVLLRSETLPIVVGVGVGDGAVLKGRTWTKDGPCIISTQADQTFSPGTPTFCYIPERMAELVSVAGGRALSAFLLGNAAM